MKILKIKTKGFVFTLDALFATIVAVTIIATVYHFTSTAQRDYFVESQLAAFANDILVVLEKDGTLESLNIEKIERALEDALPDNYAAQIKIDSYKYQEGFLLESTIISSYPVGADATMPYDIVRAKNNFVTFSDGKIRRYNIGEIKLWLR